MRPRWIGAALAAALWLAATGGVQAQERRFEIVAGARYPLLSQRTEIVQDVAAGLRLLVHAGDRFAVGPVYERLESQDDLKRTVTLPDSTVRAVSGDAVLELYGIEGLAVLSGEQRFQIYMVAGIGRGSLSFDSSIPAGAVVNQELPPGRVDSTDISLWYELGAGFLFRTGERWSFRLQLTTRTMEPEKPSALLWKAETALVPSASVGLRF